MIDNIKILVAKHLDYSFLANQNSLSQSNQSTFEIWNDQRDHKLLLTWRRQDFVIEGSLRKWLLGKNSYYDLSPLQFLKALILLARRLDIKIGDILNAEIKKIEFGLTFHLPIHPANIIDAVFYYSSFPMATYDTSKSFQGNDYWLTLYDKCQELKDKNEDVPIDTPINLLRIELKLFTKHAFENKFRGVRTVKEVFKNYRLLICSFLYEVEKVEMRPIDLEKDRGLVIGKSKKDFDNYLLFRGVISIGLRQTALQIKSLGISRSGKTRMRNKIRRILAKYQNPAQYNRNHFIQDTIKHQLKSKMSEKVPRL